MSPTKEAAFIYPSGPHARQHGPDGYVKYSSYKEWLRDEFVFRCIFCLTREVWYPDGSESFGVEHFEPKSRAASRTCDYDNLFYCCNHCNRLKSTKSGFINPCDEDFSEHLYIDEEAKFCSLTKTGAYIVRELKLNEGTTYDYRRRMLYCLKENANRARWLAYPSDLPNLKSLRPPTNHRRDGRDTCHFVKWKSGGLTQTY